jgi:hypothetical protein
MLQGSKGLIHGIENKDGEDVVITEGPHGDDTFGISTQVGESITKWLVIGKLDLETLE